MTTNTSSPASIDITVFDELDETTKTIKYVSADILLSDNVLAEIDSESYLLSSPEDWTSLITSWVSTRGCEMYDSLLTLDSYKINFEDATTSDVIECLF